MKKAEIILHPIRIRIIQALVSGERMTTQKLQDRITDVPQATLYRHLKKMVEAGVLLVVEEIPNRGTLEKVYMLPDKAAVVSQEDLESTTSEEHLTYFMNFVASMIGDYGRYLQQSDLDLGKDGVSYRQAPVYLSDEENLHLLKSIGELIRAAMENQPNENRRKRLISVIDYPEV